MFLAGLSTMLLESMLMLLVSTIDLALRLGGASSRTTVELLLRVMSEVAVLLLLLHDLVLVFTAGSFFILCTEARCRGRDFSSKILLHTGQHR